MVSTRPKVTVIIPNYNHARYLPQRLDSVLQQTYQNVEILLLDDCSSDHSREVITNYAARDARIQTVFNEQNSGSTFRQWNKGIALAKGDYVWLAESDDYAHPTLLERALQKFAIDASIGLVYVASQAIDEQGSMLPLLDGFYDDLDRELWQHDFVLNGRELVTKFMSYRNIIPNASAVLIRRDVLLRTGVADGSLKLNGDWVFWAAILAQTKVAFIGDRLNFFRFHLNNVRSKVQYNGIAVNEMSKVIDIMRQYGEPDPVFFTKSINALTEMWMEGIVRTSISWKLHQEIYANLKKISPGFDLHFAKSFIKFMLENKLSGARRLLGDGIVYKYFKKK